jgi:hypothetical protein
MPVITNFSREQSVILFAKRGVSMPRDEWEKSQRRDIGRRTARLEQHSNFLLRLERFKDELVRSKKSPEYIINAVKAKALAEECPAEEIERYLKDLKLQ